MDMDHQIGSTSTAHRYSPLWQLVKCRLLEFFREPEVWFWVYGFPVLMIVALGIAFRNQPVQQVAVDVVDSPLADQTVQAILSSKAPEQFKAEAHPEDRAKLRLRTGKTDVLVVPAETGGKLTYQYLFDPSRPQSVLARNAVDDQLQRAAGRQDLAEVTLVPVEDPGGRYIDFLVPGLLGMGLMGGGMWGVGFVTVDMRIRKLLKRFLATPMKRSHFLAGLMISRMIGMIPEMVLIVLFARYAFGVVNHGSAWAVTVLILLGAFMFASLGLLVASRAKTLEAVSGLMNMVQLPMWILSGIFFSSDRFPDAAQPFIKALPMTPLIDSLRAVMLEGASLISQLPRIGIISAWAIGCFVLALRLFRWR